MKEIVESLGEKENLRTMLLQDVISLTNEFLVNLDNKSAGY
jgi:hypothetical protein